MKEFFNCEEIKKYLFDVLDDEAPKNIKEAFFKHIENCNSCMQLYKTHLNIKNVLRDDKIYLNEEFTQHIMNKIKSIKYKPQKPKLFSVMKIAGPIVAAAACVLFVFAVINKGLLDKSFDSLQDKAAAPNEINNFALPEQESADENLNSDQLPIDENVESEDNGLGFGLTAMPSELPEDPFYTDNTESQPVNPPEAAKDKAAEDLNRALTVTPSDNNVNFDAYKDKYNTLKNNIEISQDSVIVETEENPAVSDDDNAIISNPPIFDYVLPILGEAYENQNYKYTTIIHLYPSEKNDVINTLSEKFNFVTQIGNIFYIYTTNDNYDKVREYFNIPKGEESSIKVETNDELTNLNTADNDAHMILNEDTSFKNYSPAADQAMLFIRIYNDDYETYLENNK
ncbi:MAG: hypothetical protein K0S55_974 [Clostridia bacterium]|nr:hypothetical protein [Clostridia bacterium]